jgi:hypothetical protein
MLPIEPVLRDILKTLDGRASFEIPPEATVQQLRQRINLFIGDTVQKRPKIGSENDLQIRSSSDTACEEYPHGVKLTALTFACYLCTYLTASVSQDPQFCACNHY